MSFSLFELRTLFRALFLAALLTITTLAFLPNYDNLPEIVSLSDILNHTIAFFVLYLLMEYAYFTTKTLKKLSFFLIYATFIEVVQYFLPTRCADFYDIIADMVGVLLALFLLKKIKS